MSKLRWGVVGVGRAGRARVAALRADPRADVVCGHRGDPGAVGLPSVSLEELLDRVDAVAVCAPDRHHPTLVLRALEQGRFVLCEFPLCKRPELAAQLLATGRVHVEHIELLTPAAGVLRDLQGVRSASVSFTGPPRDSFSPYHANIARLHRAVHALGLPSGVERDALLYPGFRCELDFGPGPRRTRVQVDCARGLYEQVDGELRLDGRPVELPAAGGLFVRDQLAASARFLDGAAPYVSDERVARVLGLACDLAAQEGARAT